MRHAASYILILIVLCSTGCASGGSKIVSVEPILILPAFCPRPQPPALPKLAGVNLLESRQGYAILKLRDQKIRDYIKGLNAALECYEGQTQGRTHEPQ